MDENLDRILCSDQDVVPSSAFVRNVMAVVRHDASTPGPIPFPWRRVVPGLVICAVALTALLVVAVIQFSGGAVASFVPTRLVSARIGRNLRASGYVYHHRQAWRSSSFWLEMH